MAVPAGRQDGSLGRLVLDLRGHRGGDVLDGLAAGGAGVAGDEIGQLGQQALDRDDLGPGDLELARASRRVRPRAVAELADPLALLGAGFLESALDAVEQFPGLAKGPIGLVVLALSG